MKLTAFLLLVTISNIVGSRSYSQSAPLNLDMKDVPMLTVLNALESQSEFFFLYSSKMIDINQKVSIQAENKNINGILDELFAGKGIKYSVKDRQILLVNNDAKSVESTQRQVTGKITDSESGDPLPGVTVLVKGSTVGVNTDMNGQYSIAVSDPNAILVFSFIGYSTIEVPLAGKSVIDIALVTSTKALEEVVVIGYGTQKKSEVTGAIASVSGKTLSAITTGGVQEALQGRLAGVNIIPTSGQPGGALDVTIRGVATFGNGNPLFVVDGIPIMSETGSRNFNPLSSINTDDIQSVQVLKDASAAAIYGTRAANGVILITTNRGSAGANQIHFKVSRGVSEVTKFIHMMDTPEYITFSTEAYSNAGRAIPIAFVEPLLTDNLKVNTNWVKSALKPANTQNYWLGTSGGNNIANYSLSAGYLNEEGNLPSSGYQRYSFNVNSDFKIGSKLKIGETIGLSQSKWTGTFAPSSNRMRHLHQGAPDQPIYKADAIGGFDGPRINYSPIGRENIIGYLTLIQNDRTTNKIVGSVYAEIEIIPGLTNRTNFGEEMTFDETVNFTPTYEMGNYVVTLASLTEARNSEYINLIENTTTFKKVFNDVHSVTALIGFTQQKSWSKSIGVTVRTFPDNNLRVINAATEDRDINGDQTGWALRSQIGRLSYTYSEKYNVMAVVRRDGSSRFGINNRYGIFPSISGSWRIKKEPFMDNLKSISNLTLRASYGQVGSQDVSNFAQYAVIQSGVDYDFGTTSVRVPGSSYLTMGNSDLKWEVTKQTNVGLDLDFFSGKLTSVLDIYIKNTDGVLVQLPIVSTSGIRRNNGPFVNAGSIQNKGFELSLTYQNTFAKDFDYSISGNISTNQNKVTKLNQTAPIIAQLSSGKQIAYTITQEGKEIGAFYGYVMEGIFKDAADVTGHATQSGSAAGDVKFKDLNNDGVINADDQTVIGSPSPDFIYSITGSLKYKNIDLSVFLNGMKGQDIYNLVWADLNEAEGDNNQTVELLNRWTPANTVTNVPRAVTGNPGQNTRPSSRFVEDASFLRIQNVQLGYALPSFLVKRLRLSNLRIALSAQNLYTFTKYKGYNPEIAKISEGARSSLTKGVDFAMIPIPRRIEASIQVDF